ncbi:c-type cytochrome [Phototrophicus methaneseepsis]|uniref:C-type cytochrome n=1 Tax=Phototrophicus methaneseepsis TaxID=2710758 RepID=A0A7S8E5N1_9CHLR|nr:c-type cytochrome [Phototrophicus methaneseepsis]QPC80837.1 c-type cytochrome [Phototrophicus methaneseepsis]
MTFREAAARTILVVILLGLPIGILGYRYVLQPFLSPETTFEVQAYAPESGGFSPAVIQVEAGKEVTLRFTSMDVTHGVAIGPGLDAAIDHIDPGEQGEITLTFDKPGTYTYYCTTWCSADHWRMRGIIEVRDPVNPDLLPQVQSDPVIEGLLEEGIDIDADHEGEALAIAPSAARGGDLIESVIVPDEVRQVDWQRTHSPAEALTILQTQNASYSDAELRDVIAYLWMLNTTSTVDTIQTYNQNCAACHGESGNGAGPAAYLTADVPAVFDDPGYMFSMRADVLYAKIRRGGMGTDMPNFGTLFTREETWALVDYLWLLAFEPTLNE